MPATPRIRMVYKNKGLVKRGCCVVTNCPPPTAGNITIDDLGPSGNPTYDTLYSYTIEYTNATSFQWYYALAPNYVPVAFVDGSNVSGSQTSTLLIKIKTTGCPPTIVPANVYCIVTNTCGSATSTNAGLAGCGF